MQLVLALAALGAFAGSYIATWQHNWLVALLCVALSVSIVEIGTRRYVATLDDGERNGV